MVEATNRDGRRAARRWLHVPSFAVASTISGVVLALFVVWVFVDASFGSAIDASLMLTRIKADPGFGVKHWLTWDKLGGRIAVLAAIVSVGVAANLVVAGRLAVGRSGGRSISAYLVATALVGAWLSFFLCYEKLEWHGFKFRLARRLPELQALCERLGEHWPTADGTLPLVGGYRVEEKYPNLLQLTDVQPVFPFSEVFGTFIHRQPSGVIQVDLGVQTLRNKSVLTLDCQVEFVPPGSQPADFTDKFEELSVQYTLVESERLAGAMHLAWYEMFSPELSPRLDEIAP